jgi:hypothetical protein
MSVSAKTELHWLRYRRYIAEHLDRPQTAMAQTHNAVDSLRKLLERSQRTEGIEHRTVPSLPADDDGGTLIDQIEGLHIGTRAQEHRVAADSGDRDDVAAVN